MGTTRTSQPEVEDVAMMDRLESMALLDLRESNLYSASPLHLHGLPLVKSNYASFESLDPLVACPDCKVRRFIGPTMSRAHPYTLSHMVGTHVRMRWG